MTNMLEVNNIAKEYIIGTEKIRALDGVSFNVNEGEIVGLIGRSGGGKSTLLNIIRGFETFDEGTLKLDELLVTPDSGSDIFLKLKQITAIHLQRSFALWSDYVVNDVLRKIYSLRIGYEGLPPADLPEYDDLVEEAMVYVRMVGLQEKAKHVDYVLSGGEKQRVIIARQLAKKPKILLLDEPATMACPATKQEILDTLKKVNSETKLTMLCASHLPEIHRYLVDRLIWLDGGKVILEGDPEYVLTEFLKEMPDPIPLSKIEPGKREAVIKVEDVSHRFYLISISGETLRFDSLNFNINKGEITSIIGPSGAGKTVLWNMLCGFLFPKEGKVLYRQDDEWVNMSQYHKKRMEIRRRVGVMFQEFALSPHETIVDQLAFKLGVKGQHVIAEAQERAEELGITEHVLDTIYQIVDMPETGAKDKLESLGFSPDIFGMLFPRFPRTETVKYAESVFGALDLPMDVLDKYPQELSGGEKVRAMLAITLAPKPDILLLDEPFGDLDPITLRDITNSLKRINAEFGTTILLISHHLNFVREVSHRTILIDDGEFITEGKPDVICDELVKRSGAAYLQ
ncbi:MAG: ATP-binding cassette domain-containing protein [Euryarchaeota archaeon]|nr:ATP-binding cassette domain-containing protein [Euryarchaeota archaeon]